MDAERELLTNIHHHVPELEALLTEVQDPLTYEDSVYRFYDQSRKVYELQGLTPAIARRLAAIAPGGRPFCLAFQELLDAGAGEVRFEAAHNEAWTQHTRACVEAFLHAPCVLEMAVTYGRRLAAPPRSSDASGRWRATGPTPPIGSGSCAAPRKPMSRPLWKSGCGHRRHSRSAGR